MATIWIQVIVVYVSDDTKSYQTGMQAGKGIAGGFALAAAITNAMPRGKYMRHVYGATSSDDRYKLPIASAGNALYTTGGTFTVPLITSSIGPFTVQGRIGEKNTVKI
jgi:hypothetical protein